MKGRPFFLLGSRGRGGGCVQPAGKRAVSRIQSSRVFLEKSLDHRPKPKAQQEPPKSTEQLDFKDDTKQVPQMVLRQTPLQGTLTGTPLYIWQLIEGGWEGQLWMESIEAGELQQTKRGRSRSSLHTTLTTHLKPGAKSTCQTGLTRAALHTLWAAATWSKEKARRHTLSSHQSSSEGTRLLLRGMLSFAALVGSRCKSPLDVCVGPHRTLR